MESPLEHTGILGGLAPQEPTLSKLPELTIEELPPYLRTAVGRAGWTRLMPVQAKALPYILQGNDVMVQSRTGSGKTGGFILPTLERIDSSESTCQALVLVPTRELANQVAAEAHMLSGGTVRTVAVYGGVSYKPQRDAFQRGAHLVIGTPGRVLDHLMSGNFSLNNLRMLVFDEADRMLSVGFYPDMKQVQRFLPKTKVNTCMFSATFPPHVVRLANEFLDNPVVLSLSSDHVHVTDVEHISYTIKGTEKDDTLVNILEQELPSSAIIFCNTKMKVNYVTVVLQRYGYNADQLSGDMPQHKREKVLKLVREGKLRFLIATDVAARGIDIPDLSHVVQYEVPENPEVYIHRAGRTGRAGASGTAIILVDILEQLRISKIIKLYEIDMQQRTNPEKADIATVVTERVEARLQTHLRNLSAEQRSTLNSYETMVELLCMNADGIRALAMLVDDYYQATVYGADGASADMISVPTMSEVEMGNIAQALNGKMQSRDRLQSERMTRFEALVEDLSMRGEEFHALTLLCWLFHQQMQVFAPARRDDRKSGKGKEKFGKKRRPRRKKKKASKD